MKLEDFIDSVNNIHADSGLKAKVLSGKRAVHGQKPILSPFSKCVACFALIAVLAFAAMHMPQVLKPAGTVSQGMTAQSGSPGHRDLVNGLYHDDAIRNILVLGLDDSQKNGDGYSDEILLVSIDIRHSKLKLTSFLRDMYLNIPGHGENKLVSAYTYGGAPLTVKTIENNFGVGIDDYVTLDYNAFTKIIDRLGGVTLTVSADEVKLINTYSGEDAKKRLKSGTVLLTGKQALYYSRIRCLDSDIIRTDRQRKVIKSAVSKLKVFSYNKIPSIVEDVFPLVKTSMGKDGILALSEDFYTCIRYPVSEYSVPGEHAYEVKTVSINGMETQIIEPELKKNREEIIKFIFE